MLKHFRTAALLLAFTAAPAFAEFGAPEIGKPAPEIGKPAPEFSVQDITGKPQSLAQYKGSIVVLEWNNPGCPFVRKHYDSGNMQGLQAYARSKGITWLTVNSSANGQQGSMSESEAVGALAKEKASPTAYILDPAGTLGKLYGAKTTPHMFVVDKEGNLAYAGAIDDKPGTDKAEAATANNYVKNAINSLLRGEPVAEASTTAYGCSVKYAD